MTESVRYQLHVRRGAVEFDIELDDYIVMLHQGALGFELPPEVQAGDILTIVPLPDGGLPS